MKRFLFLTNRPIDSADIFCPIIQALTSLGSDVEVKALSPYQWMFPDAEIDMELENANISTIHKSKSSAKSVKEELANILSDWKPNVVIAPIDQPVFYQELLDISKKAGAKTAVINESPITYIQAGAEELISRVELKRYFSQETSRFSPPLSLDHFPKEQQGPDTVRYRGQSGADLVLVCGKNCKELLIKRGVSEKSVEVVGWVRGHTLSANARLSGEEVRKELGIKKERPYVILVSQSFLWSDVPVRANDFEELVYAATVTKKLRPEVQPILTVHPAVSLEEARASIENFPGHQDIILSKGFSDRGALSKHCEFAIGFFSTALVELMIHKKPILTLDYVALQQWYPANIEYGAVVPCFHRFSVERQLQRIIFDKNVKVGLQANQVQLLKDVVGYPADGVIDRIARAIYSIC